MAACYFRDGKGHLSEEVRPAPPTLSHTLSLYGVPVTQYLAMAGNAFTVCIRPGCWCASSTMMRCQWTA